MADLSTSSQPPRDAGHSHQIKTPSKRLLRNHENMIYWAQVALDLFLVTCSFFVLVYMRTGGFAEHYQFALVITVLLQVIIYRSRGVYRRSAKLLSGLARLAGAWIILLSVLTALGFLLKAGDHFSRQVFVTWALMGFALQALSYFVVCAVSEKYREKFARVIPAMVIGNGSLSHHLSESLEKNRWMADKVVAHVSLGLGSEGARDALNSVQPISAASFNSASRVNFGATNTGGDDKVLAENGHPDKKITHIDDLNALRALIRNCGVKRVYLAVPISDSSQIEMLHIGLMDLNVDLIWVPDIYALNLLNHSIREVAGMPLIFLNESPLTSTRSGAFAKSALDKIAAALALLAFSPIMITAAIAVKLSSPGPVFFKQERHGWDGKIIKVWKFRSMKLHTEGEAKVTQATREDPRVTKVGKFIRRSSIDELPQLFNVLQGTMSMVGPRPHAVAHNDYYSDKINAYLARHRIKPGITGLAQVNGLRGETETLDKMEKRVEYDLAYINNWSLWLDFKIMIKTPLSLFSKNIY